MARKILLADDSVTAQNMGRKILADAGYEVIAVNNGSAALKKIAELKPDLVILDVYMPGYSGLEVCQRLKESQETARIPVLLSVGKLEPFKPEEAQRVRADSYIVKPFEASELLSALSKLEDKVVPRAEPSKPGRFARAMAAAEESSRDRKETASDQNGWSSRIGFPHEKTQPEEKVADDSAIYNPMNRDLRTVVETASEKAAEKREETQPAPVANVSETSVDVAALAPAGLPRDVTPEEVAAIAAAAAKMQMAGAVADERQASEIRPSETQASEATSGGSLEPPSDRVGEAFAAPATQEATTDGPQENRVDAAGSEAIATPEAQLNNDVKAEEAQELPVTMAAATAESAADSAPRWTAVPVTLEGEEATVSLEEEMQKAYAAYASYVAAETESDVSAMQAVEAPAPDHSSSGDAAPVVEAAPIKSSSFPEVAQVEADAVISASPEFADPNPGFVPVAESVAAAAEIPVAEPAVASHAVAEPASLVAPPAQEAQPEEAQPWSEPAPATAEAVSASSVDSAPFVEAQRPEAQKPEAREPNAHEPAEESKPESEAVKSTAAAWASWRQIRDTRKDSEVAQPKSQEFEVPEPVPAETAARAVAAGAEQISQEVSAAPKSDVADVASIVESVLANLRPKLMEEISRKMAEKK